MRLISHPLFGSLCLALLLAVPGCGSSPAAEAAKTRQSSVSTADVAMPPKELLEAVKRAVGEPPLALGIEQQDRGTLVTGWKRYRGDWHIGRYWQERTRFRIDVSPDFDDPTTRSRLSVVAETEQRAAEGQRWDREPRIPRPQRAQDALKHIVDRVQQGAPTTRQG